MSSPVDGAIPSRVPQESIMLPVLFSNLLWLGIVAIYAGLLFWQAGRDRKAGTGFVDED